MEANWTKIYSTNQLHLAEITKAVLEDHEITIFMLNKKDSMYLFGEIELYALKGDVLRAINIIKKNEL